MKNRLVASSDLGSSKNELFVTDTSWKP